MTEQPSGWGYEQAKEEIEAEDAAKRVQPNGVDPSGSNIRFQFTQFRDIKLDTAPAYVVGGMIPRLGIVVVWGKPKCGKTFWVFDVGDARFARLDISRPTRRAGRGAPHRM
jgi:hypothetical protein